MRSAKGGKRKMMEKIQTATYSLMGAGEKNE